MLTGLLHAFGIMEILDRLGRLIPKERIVDGGAVLYRRFDERFKLAAREKFWPWVLTDFQPRDPAGYDLLFARQRERHKWQGSGGAFNALSETYMNVAFGRVFEQETDPENRFRIFGDVARMDDADFAAWLDAVTDDGFEQYFAHVRHLAVHLWWPEVQRLHTYADRALRIAAGAVGIFFAAFVGAEISGWDLIHVVLAIFVVVGIGVAWWQWPTLVVALSAPKQTRKALEPVAAGFATAMLLIVVGMFVPTHLAPWKMQAAALVSLVGLGAVAYWGFLKGVKSPLFSPKTVGFVFASVILLAAFWAFNEKHGGALVESGIRPMYNWSAGVAEGAFSSSAEASVLESEERSSCIATRSAGWSERAFLVDKNWSEIQKIPPQSEFLVNSTIPVVVEFVDGSRYTVQPDECDGNGFGHHALAHFRARSLDGGVASVTISHRSIR